ncbi:MAG TPA: tail fiber protein [Pyrinomonadaceae bacterium]|nr:tail fiber protein [Pyrinomonadaceae bacterium]
MSEPYIGQIRIMGCNFAPRGNALCQGQLIPIAQNTALFSILGTMYGGNGQTTFALPDLRGRAPMHTGQGPGLTPRSLGEMGGSESVTLTSNQMPIHSHSPGGVTSAGNQQSPSGAVWASSTGGRTPAPLYQNTQNTPMRNDLIQFAGGGQPHNNMQPYLALTFVIALQGLFPPFP